MSTTKTGIKKQIAFVVHPDRKADLVEWSYFNNSLLQQHEITASGDAANILEGTLNKAVHKFVTGPNDSYQELCNLVNNGKIDAVIFFRSAQETAAQKNAVRAIMHCALEADIIIAGNKISADFILSSPLMQEEITFKRAFYNIEQDGNGQLKKNNAA